MQSHIHYLRTENFSKTKKTENVNVYNSFTNPAEVILKVRPGLTLKLSPTYWVKIPYSEFQDTAVLLIIVH